ncbi:MAG: hypothetical protein ACHQQQ_08785 [Bacteroidota bacterium]
MKKHVLSNIILLLFAGLIVLSSTNTLLAVDKNFNFSRAGANGLEKVSVTWVKQYLQGYNFRIWIANDLVMGKSAFDGAVPPPICGSVGIGCEYPIGSCIEHMFGAGPWIGGLINGKRYVTEAYNGDAGDSETIPEQEDSLRNIFWISSVSDTGYDMNRPGYYKRAMNRKGFDDDGDGKIDEDELDGYDNDHDWVRATDDIGADGIPDSLEVGCNGGYDPIRNPDPAYDNYEPGKYDSCHPNPNGSFPKKNLKDKYTEKNGVPDHGEPHVDEDYASISDNDVYVTSTDTFRNPVITRHHKMGIKIFQKSYAWQEKFAEAILPMQYSFINVGKNIITDVYVAFFNDVDLGPVSNPNYYQNNYSAYFPDIRTGYVQDPIDRGSTPVGLTVLAAPRSLDSLKYIWQWFDFTTRPSPGTDDSTLYSWMSGEKGLIYPNQPPTNPSDTRFFFSFGPFATMNPGDTLRISVALVSGNCVDQCQGSLRDNALNAIKLYNRGYYLSVEPPSPRLKVTQGFKRVTLDWGTHLGGPNPQVVWDDSNKLAEKDPRRHSNPPPGHHSGGRIFEGYRLYRSEDPSGTPSSFTMLRQFDTKGDTFGYSIGLDSIFVDSNLVRGKTYWYSVTSFGIPDVSYLQIPDSTKPHGVDTLILSSDNIESSVLQNRTEVTLAFSPSDKLGEVMVVPNPYRVDRDYTFENGGWEGRSAQWSENSRLIKFIHLPKDCTIRIFTLAGDMVTTLNNFGSMTPGELSWNLVSESNRALASGVYVFTVESSAGRQIGKFVLIR